MPQHLLPTKESSKKSEFIPCFPPSSKLLASPKLPHIMPKHAAIKAPSQSPFLPNILKKLFRRPIPFCALSALRSRTLFPIGNAGKLGLVSGGLIGVGLGARLVFRLVILERVFPSFSLSGRSRGFMDRRLFVRPTRSLGSSSEDRLSRSISPNTVFPPVARHSSAIGTKRTTPRSEPTPRASVMNVERRAALRLLVVDWRAEGRAVRVRM